MSGSSFGNIFKITTWGESHGKAIGVVIDGCPSGVELTEDDIQELLDRRKPGSSKFATKRNESDLVQIMSGVFENKTTGAPISLIIYNEDQNSKDYGNIKEIYRPGHADYTFDKKFGFRDYRGGGRSSGRETAARVAAGAVAKKILDELGVNVEAYVTAIKDIEIDRNKFDKNEIFKNPLFMPDKEAASKAMLLLEDAMRNKDSVGGVVECKVSGLKAGVGEPVFDKLDANIAKAIFSIGGVKALEIGAGFDVIKKFGSENNDEFYCEDSVIKKRTNNAGGILGGISDGFDIILKSYFKPTPSIYKKQSTINRNEENIEIEIKGRHDPIIVARAVVVVESMVAITVLDLILSDALSRIENIKKLML